MIVSGIIKRLSIRKIVLLFGSLLILLFVLFALTQDTSVEKQTESQKSYSPQQVVGVKTRDQSTIEDSQNFEEVSQSEDVNTEFNVEGVKVTKVIDGDTIEIEGGQRIRYIGIDAPETVHPTKTVDCYGKESSNKNKEIVEGKIVRLEKDISETDKYRRLLRYVFVDDIFVNDYLVRQGFASASSYPPDIKYQDQFRQAEKEARENAIGLWGSCKSQSSQQSQSTETVTQPTNQNCHPAYPGVCISTPPPDLDCPDIAYRRFKVLPPDPHNFDSDHDGVGCESL